MTTQDVTPDTPWRETGDTTVEGLVAEFRRRSVASGASWMRGYVDESPLIAEAAEINAAAGGLSRLVAAMGLKEQQHATVPDVATAARLQREQGIEPTLTTIVPNQNHNHLSIKLRHTAKGPEWREYPSYAACVAAWQERLLAEDGPYAGTKTIREMIAVYAPSSDGNDVDRYIADVVAVINRMPLSKSLGQPTKSNAGQTKGTRPTSPVVVRQPVVGRVPRPGIIRDEYVTKSLGLGSADYGVRLGRMLVLHRVQGRAKWTRGHFMNLADPHGRMALTDWGVDAVAIYDWNDPDGRGARRSPYASGGEGGETGDGPAFVKAYGRIAINRDGEAVEIDGFFEDAVDQATFDNLIALLAWRADRKLGVSYEQWPKNRDGVHALYWHDEFQTEKPCPGRVVKEMTTEIIAKTGERMKRFQLADGAVPGPVVTPVPILTPVPGTSTEPVTSLPLPPGVALADLGDWFGRVTAANGGIFAFDPSGPVTEAWLAYGAEEGRWPELEGVTVTGDRRLFRFADGLVLVAAPGKGVERLAA